jgi:ABC-type multidrug transport system fused ATPase/permease subunit
LYKDSKIVLLDDATVKMDQNTEQEIVDEIYKLKNKIIIMISNRIHNLTKCDKIMILNNGRIIEYGKTEDLLDNKKSTFAKMMSEYEVTKTRVG